MGTVKAPLLDEQQGHSHFEQDEVRSALERLLTSSAFHGSARCQQFIRFVVERTLEGNAASIKERTIAIEVFGRPADYESSEDSIVRVKAGEIRKRLRQYYESEGQRELIVITLPRGGYVPHFQVRDFPPSFSEEDASPSLGSVVGSRPGWTRWAAIGIFSVIVTVTFSVMFRSEKLVDSVWAPMLRNATPILIYVPVPGSHKLHGPVDGSQNQAQPLATRISIATDKVGLGAAAGAVSVAAFCARKDHPYRLKFGRELHFSDLRTQPALLLGAFSSQWSPRMSQGHRFELRDSRECSELGRGHCIFDTERGISWYAIERDGLGGAKRDVAIAARVRHQQTGMPLMIAAGITTYGTQGAAEFLLSEESLTELKGKAGVAWSGQDFQAVIEVPIVEGSPGRPRLLAWHFW